MNNVKVALLGSGFVAEFYMQGLHNVAGQKCGTIIPVVPNGQQSFAKRWRIPHATTDLDALIARNDMDLFIIALPNEEHLPVSLKLSAAKRNQVCTKPLGRNRAEAKQMFDAAVKSGALHGYAETEVFAPCVVKAREVIEQGTLGKVLWVRSRESHSGPHSPHFWDVTKTGGGAMHDLGCHCIAAARYFFGKEDRITEAMAWGANLVHHEKTKGEDNALLDSEVRQRRHRALRTFLDNQRRPRSAQRDSWLGGFDLYRRHARHAHHDFLHQARRLHR